MHLFHYGIRQTARIPFHSHIRKDRGLLASQTFTRNNPLPITTSHPLPPPSNFSNGFPFILHFRKSLVDIAVIPVSHTRRHRLRIDITRLPTSHSAVSPRSRLGSVTRTRHDRKPPATILHSPLLELLREWRACSQRRTIPVDRIDGKDKHEGNGEED